jgi:RNA polymerase sigma-70 factor (ECF subfamily)
MSDLDEPIRPEPVVPVRAVVRPEAIDAVAFEHLYAEHYRDVFRYVLALTRSSDEAEDIVADTFERAFRHRADLSERPIAWLLLTARRLATDRWRRLRRAAGLLRNRSLAAATPAGPEVDPEFTSWFDSLMRVLPARQREVLVLRYQRDLADADIATVMGLSESGVRSLVARALANLWAHPELLG